MDWNKRSKNFLVDVGMAKDEPGLIHEYHILLHCLNVMLNTYHSICSLRSLQMVWFKRTWAKK
jgi:hypothetical protein